MTRNVTDAFIAACNAPQTDEGFLVCVTITHPELPSPIYLINNSQNVIRTIGSVPITFLACPIYPTLSDDSDDRPPQAKLVMDNIDRTLVAAFREIIIPPTVMLELVKISDPDIAEATFTDFQMKEISYNSLTIEGTLTLEGLFSEPAIGFSFTPSYYPGLF